MTISTICLIAAMVIIPLLTESNYRTIRGYIIFDSIDIHCEIQAVPFAQLSQMQPGEPSSAIRERMIKARQIQTERFKASPQSGGLRGAIHCNAQMTERMLHEFAEPDSASLDMLRMAMERLKLSARAYSRILKVAAPSPTSPARRRCSLYTLRRPSAIVTLTAVTGQREVFSIII